MRIALIAIVLLISTSAQAQYKNYEVQPDGTGGYSGTYGNRNFEVTPEPRVGGNINGRRPGIIRQRAVRTSKGHNSAGRFCVVDRYGNTICN